MHFHTAMMLISAIAASQNPPMTAQTLDLSGLGSCSTQNGFVDLRRVAFLENRSIDTESPTGTIRISVSEESVDIQSIGEGSNHRTFVHDLGDQLGRGLDIDIELKLGILEGNLVVYWRETFQHKSYRQGLFTVAPPNLMPLCEGRGGFDSG